MEYFHIIKKIVDILCALLSLFCVWKFCRTGDIKEGIWAIILYLAVMS